MVDLDTPVELLDGSLSGLRVYAGYAGWEHEQLRTRSPRGAGMPSTAEPVDAFRSDTTDLWRDVLRRQPGQLAWHTTRPARSRPELEPSV